MLKALELVGFKSFADKTRFEFPDGITVVVGPNGSGKSNVVDAIKWVLGEQSVKAMRGQDMSDVIFKGSGTSGRKPANIAEATIIFENSDRRLPVDAPEVHVTRRVYRSGEGEYLINRQPCRLKDIKDLFRGTGVGVDAYSIIEQGKVDRLLQASPKDRRAMFEEAAGISRFKAKKVECQRRLERVDQNLLRLNDIVEEVDARLRGVRAQAAKAKRFREYSERLQQLRTQVGLTDWRKLTEKLTGIERELERVRLHGSEINGHTEQLEARAAEIETEAQVHTEAIREGETRVGRLREQIVGLESHADQQRARERDVEDEASRGRQNLVVLTNRAGDVVQRLAELRDILAKADREHEAVVAQVHDLETQMRTLTVELDHSRGQTEVRRNEYVAAMRTAAALSNEVGVRRSQLASLSESAQRCRHRLEDLAESLTACTAEKQQLQAGLQALESTLAERGELLVVAERELAENRRLFSRRQQDVVELLGRLSGAKERTSLLEELEFKREGVGSGVKEILDLAKREPNGPCGEVRCLVADVLQATLEVAPLIDVALGHVSQHVLTTGTRLIERIASGAFRPSARVGVIRLPSPDEPKISRPLEKAIADVLEIQPGVMGRADRMVETAAEFHPIVHRLLSTTWFVDDLNTALRLQQNFGSGRRFVTSAGQLLEPDGTVVAGPRQAAEGLVSRRSELRDVKNRISVLEFQIAEGQREVLRLQENIHSQDRDVRQMTDEQRELTKTLNEQRARIGTLERKQNELEQQRTTSEADLLSTVSQQDAETLQLETTTTNLVVAEAEIISLESSLRQQDRRSEELDTDLQQGTRNLTAAKVDLAKSEQRLEGMRSQVAQFEHDQRERSKAVAESRAQLAQCLERRQQCDRAVLKATSELADLFFRKEQQTHETRAVSRQRDEILSHRAEFSGTLTANRKMLKALAEEQHVHELAANEVRHERQGLVDRLRDDYSIEIAELQATETETGEALQQRDQIEDEITTLRKKINSLGAVNMDALVELDEMEARHGSIASQVQDLRQAKETLERIIQKINADSRKLFLDTLEAIRTNFHTLYRRAFGGGKADIVLEEGADVLECGVEIVATPPGKPSFNNSLLSGGEKALTAVALLLAIFQFRPSPFCVLDEVDAPFDEANVGRFVSVLTEFLSFTKFIIVTHSKKTMTAATTLYGVTMQESGVSKRVSVQFNDVTEDGHIRKEAVEREAA